MENLEEIENIYPTHLKRKLIHARERSIINTIRAQAEHICRYSINPQYIRSAFNNFQYGFVYYDNEKCVGFCIWKEHNSFIEKNNAVRKAYIDLLLICTTLNDYKLGSMILHDIDTYAHSQTMNYITLQPATLELIKFYEKSGYTYNTITNQCEKPITPFIIKRPVNAKTRKLRHTRSRNRTSTLLNNLEPFNSINGRQSAHSYTDGTGSEIRESQ